MALPRLAGRWRFRGLRLLQPLSTRRSPAGLCSRVVDSVVGLRVGEEEETIGLDLVLHDERGL